ncbi:MAG: hypothetical protein GY803_26395, partial [Chloroflexi bacterium]|nr:hypothetical protein [Chloroflexota bacterium]
MRRFLLTALAIILFLAVVGGAGTYVVAARAPFQPGNMLYAAQLWSEQQWGLSYNRDAVNRAGTLLILLERRLDDLEAVRGTKHELLALTYVDAALDQALLAVSEAPDEARPRLQARLAQSTERALALINGLDVMTAIPVETAVIA